MFTHHQGKRLEKIPLERLGVERPRLAAPALRDTVESLDSSNADACRRMKPQLDSRMNEAEPWTPQVVGARLKGLRGTHRSRDGEGTLGVETGSSYNRYGTAALGSRISCPERKHFIHRAEGANALSRNAHATWPTQQCVLRVILSGWGATTSSERVMHGLELHNTRAARPSLIGR